MDQPLTRHKLALYQPATKLLVDFGGNTVRPVNGDQNRLFADRAKVGENVLTRQAMRFAIANNKNRGGVEWPILAPIWPMHVWHFA